MKIRAVGRDDSLAMLVIFVYILVRSCTCVVAYVPCEVLRQCSATNPADIIIWYVPSMTVLGLKQKSHFILFHAHIDTAVCRPMCILY